jgi:hypothetical protein
VNRSRALGQAAAQLILVVRGADVPEQRTQLSAENARFSPASSSGALASAGPRPGGTRDAPAGSSVVTRPVLARDAGPGSGYGLALPA